MQTTAPAAVHSTPARPLPAVDAARFERDGYLLLKRVFSPTEVETLRELAYRQCEIDREKMIVGNELPLREVSASYGDLLSKELLRETVMDPRLLHVARILLEREPIYFGFSSFQIGGIAFRSPRYVWHRDNRICDHKDPNGLDWEGKYPIIRFGIYLQDHARHSGGLAVKVGTHVGCRTDGKAINVPSQAGDLIVWNMRLMHAGQAVRLRFLRNLVSHDWLGKVPPWLRRKEQKERVVLFYTYCGEGPHVDRYLEYITSRADMHEFWDISRFGEEVWDLVRERGLEVKRPYHAYGTPGTPPPLSPERRQPLNA